MAHLRLLLLVASITVSFLNIDGYQHAPRAFLNREKIAYNRQETDALVLQMVSHGNDRKPISLREESLSSSRNLMISLSAVALTTIVKAKAAYAVDVDERLTTEAIAPPVARIEPVITSKVYLDIKIANYTEESTGTNKGADGSGRVVFGLYGKDAPDSVERVRLHLSHRPHRIGYLVCLLYTS